MKYILLVVLILIAVALAPFVDGYLFKKFYYQQVAYYQQKIVDNDSKDIQLQVESYELGWLKSTAHATISRINHASTNKFQIQPIVIRVKSVIHHGPFVYINGKWKFVYATVKTTIELPDILKVFVPQNPDGFMQIETNVAFNARTWDSHYSIPAINVQGMGSWDGLSGDALVYTTTSGQPQQMKNTFTIGKFSIPVILPGLPEVTGEAITGNTDATRQPSNLWTGNNSLKIPSIMAVWKDDGTLSVENVAMNMIYSASGNLYSYESTLRADNIKLPPPAPIATLSGIDTLVAIKNLDVNGLRQFKEYSRASRFKFKDADDQNMLLKTLSPSTNIVVKHKMDTDLGATAIDFTAALTALPKTVEDIQNNLNVALNANIAQPLLQKLLASFISSQSMTDTSDATDATQQAQTLIDSLINLGYLQTQNSDYIISFTQKNQERILNGKPISESDFKMIWPNINNAIENATPKPTVEPAVTIPLNTTMPTSPSAANAAPDTNGAHCYWMDNTAQNRWTLVPSLTKSDCYGLDSCSGGLKRSNGGCYKWATSADGKAEPWQ